MTLLFLYLFLALFVSFLCSVMESVLLSTPISFLNVKLQQGNKLAHIFIKLKENIDRPLAAILSLNTVAHTIGAAGVGAEASSIFGDAYFGLISAVLTILILVFSEIIPKTIGARYWRNLAIVSGQIINVMVWLTYPLVIMSNYISGWMSKNENEQTVSREEVSALAHIGTEEGVFEEKENSIIQNLIRLRTIRVSEIMTPRVVVSIADENMELKAFLARKEFLHYSRIPVFANNRENITGYVIRQLVFEKLAEQDSDENQKLKDIKRPIPVFPPHVTLIAVWETLLSKKEHIALIVDEYGGMDGIVTFEDIIETLLGIEIMDEKDEIVDMQQYARDRWAERKAKYNILDNSDTDTESRQGEE